MENNRQVFRVTMASRDVEAFLAQCNDVDWFAVDTGERIMTDDGPDADAVLLVEPVQEQKTNGRVALVH